ncbi:hypothetical protein CDL12_20113 [Handroanthus impetiginosus]|uniref:Uncharacterized protein n=1 Tax=Handroanthus impetiginosus TaxID=429701 RepID=A0A2G9GQ27_9LAMI|nr:hypothetical protein CDL12_20113 [Handroanthus impetiginosus]
MSSETDPLNNVKRPTNRHHHSTTSFRWPIRRGRQRLPTLRLGGKKPRRGFFLFRLCKRAKLKWLRLKYLSMLKKLKKYYDSFVKDMIEGSRTIESFQQRMLLETSFAIPVMGITFNTYPSSHPLERPMF